MNHSKIKSIQQQIGGGGTFQKYRSIATGMDRGIAFFLLNEMVIMLATSFPGMLGNKLRRLSYSLLCQEIGSTVHIGRECSLRRPQYITIKDGTRLGDGVSLDVKNDGKGIVLGKNVTVGHSTLFSCPGGIITIGEGATIGNYCRLGSLEGLTLGKNVTIDDASYIVGAGHAFDSLDIPIIKQNIVCKAPNFIGDDVVIGKRVTVLDGVTIGAGAQIKDDSLVNRNVPAAAVYSGVPAKKCD